MDVSKGWRFSIRSNVPGVVPLWNWAPRSGPSYSSVSARLCQIISGFEFQEIRASHMVSYDRFRFYFNFKNESLQLYHVQKAFNWFEQDRYCITAGISHVFKAESATRTFDARRTIGPHSEPRSCMQSALLMKRVGQARARIWGTNEERKLTRDRAFAMATR